LGTGAALAEAFGCPSCLTFAGQEATAAVRAAEAVRRPATPPLAEAGHGGTDACIGQSLRLSRRAGGRALQARGAAGVGAERRLLPLY
jgi:hypothetical protein